MHLDISVIIALMVAATALAMVAKRLEIPYNIALVIGGMLVAISGLIADMPQLEPEVVFLVCLPPLLFEGGITSDLRRIRANALAILTLSTFGVVIAIAVTGAALHLVLQLPWGPALLLGAMLAVTDTVSILYAFRRAPVPARLAGIMEGESLFNDGTALVAFGAILAAVTGGHFSLPELGARAVLATVGGVGVGVALALTAGVVMRRAQDPLAEIMATTALAFASYTVAEQIHVSGVIAAVTAGLATGVTLKHDLGPQSQVAIRSFWEYVAFGVNTFLFLLVGLTTSPDALILQLPSTMAAILCVFAGRAVAIYLPFFVLRLLRPAERVPLRWQHVFIIGNIKGALSIALALGLPADVPQRALLLEVAFGVTFVSLVLQGLLLPSALKRLGLLRHDPLESTVGEQQGLLIAARAARQELELLHASGVVPGAGYERLRSDYQVVIAGAERELRQLQERHIAYGARALLATRRRLIHAERAAILAANRTGMLATAPAERQLAMLDEKMMALDLALEGDQPGVHLPETPTRKDRKS